MPLLLFLAGLFLYIYIEISLLVSVGSAIGVLPLILLMITISAVGLWLVKLRGIMTIVQIRQEIAQGKIPAQAVMSSIFFAIAGVLLIIPGFLSDIVALLLLLPIARQVLQAMFMKLFASRVKFMSFGSMNRTSSQNNTTFEAEFEHKQDEDKWLK
ncbi:FxsA family protein [Glaesserella parasuis]|uniref:FxsA protein affecting phage T7 exclusion by the F plasmid n=1 Tax=Glaesserella parasuis serovar 5 (strain SH0165) TaxID=557723 RepID=B8F3D9_GLAP5|nr:FxsA family protein [Glaesserella parasuis]ACL31841.1 FxsA protein affecting phage T7 exclusion by the F plasmid [Glaesserella parasuis SH0165]MCT8720823.1 FxsA family protein [Glaesserella parasuis]MCT8727485.1 FxsA family protein [Glaesserella parasuis]MDG6247503.1 FxsA family protein [Glaesserella parasuis]MDG6373273.1 FxsA family protein [Glaesserella parasuis]